MIAHEEGELVWHSLHSTNVFPTKEDGSDSSQLKRKNPVTVLGQPVYILAATLLSCAQTRSHFIKTSSCVCYMSGYILQLVVKRDQD